MDPAMTHRLWTSRSHFIIRGELIEIFSISHYLPSNGFNFQISQDLAGLGGDSNYYRNSFEFNYYKRLSKRLIGAYKLQGGNINGYNDKYSPLASNFKLGGKKLRGFKSGKIGPKLGNSYTGGQYFYLTSLETNIDLNINAFDITTTAFIDVGSVWGLENPAYGSIDDNHEARSSIGVNFNWDSAIGPINIIYANISNHKEYIVRSKYLVGCDGANSITRKQMKTTMDNLGFTQKWAVVDLILKKKKNNLPDRTIQYSNPKQPATYCRNVGKRRRWEFAIKKNHSDKKVLSESYIWNFLKPWLKKSEAIIERKTIYTFESAIARKWRKGRVFIAGDAAHLMPPFMGQGMCAGIRDASNLAWKIANCLRNKFNETLLNTYQSERSLNVKEYIETTMRMGEFVNAVESIQITDNIKSDNKGIKSMQSIKPKLGKGLGNLKDKNRGKTFPQFKIKNNKTLDNNFSKKGMIVLSSDVNPKTPKYYSILKAKNFSNVSRYLKNIKSKAILVRPDRFILASARSNKEVNLLLKKYSSILR